MGGGEFGAEIDSAPLAEGNDDLVLGGLSSALTGAVEFDPSFLGCLFGREDVFCFHGGVGG